VEQRRPQFGFQGTDRRRQRRLGDFERLGRAGEVAVLRDGDDIGQLLGLHEVTLTVDRSRLSAGSSS